MSVTTTFDDYPQNSQGTGNDGRTQTFTVKFEKDCAYNVFSAADTNPTQWDFGQATQYNSLGYIDRTVTRSRCTVSYTMETFQLLSSSSDSQTWNSVDAYSNWLTDYGTYSMTWDATTGDFVMTTSDTIYTLYHKAVTINARLTVTEDKDTAASYSYTFDLIVYQLCSDQLEF